MAKLNTSVTNIQLKSNKVDSDVPLASWTAEQYPSAKSLYNVYSMLYPVSSVLCMAENINPADIIGIGEWELIDKEFKSRWIDISAKGSTVIGGKLTSSSGCMIAGHTLSLRINASVSIKSSDTAYQIAKLDTAALGLSEFPMAKLDIPFTIDGGEIVGNASIYKDGVVQINDGWTVKDGNIVHAIGDTYTVPIFADYAVHYSKMLDSFCNKFYFKRIA